MGRKRKNKQYFTTETQEAIIEYNKLCPDKDYKLRNELFNTKIYRPLNKLAENIIHTFKFYYFPGTAKETQHEVVAFLIEKMPKYTEGKGKAFSYFGQIAKNYCIQANNGNYKRMLRKAKVEAIDHQRNITNEIIRDDIRDEVQDFFTCFVEYCDRNAEKIVSKPRDLKILYALIQVFKTRENLENFNKKALYIMVREMTDVKTQYITRVVNILKSKYEEMYLQYQNGKRF